MNTIIRIPVKAACTLLLLCSLLSPAYAGSSFSGERIVASAKSYVQKLLGRNTEIEYIGNVQAQEFKQDGVFARFKVGESSGSGSYAVVVEFVSGDRAVRMVNVPFRITQFALVPVATKALPAGVILTENMIRFEKKQLPAQRESNQPKEPIIGMKLKEAVAAGEAIELDNLLSAEGIQRGQSVTLVVKSGNIVISTSATALADAQPGETVTVIRKGAKTTIRAKAVDARTVEAF